VAGMKRSRWKEVHVRDTEHLGRIVLRLISDEVEFDVRPEPDGWWRVRADDRSDINDTTGLRWIVQTTRLAGVA
jgi:hypothetical protein